MGKYIILPYIVIFENPNSLFNYFLHKLQHEIPTFGASGLTWTLHKKYTTTSNQQHKFSYILILNHCLYITHNLMQSL